MLVVMVRIPVGSPDDGERMLARFKNRAGLVDDMPGFLGFELLHADSELVSVTRWASRDDLDRWMSSQQNAAAHARVPTPTGGGHPRTGQATDAGNGPSGSVMVYEVAIEMKVKA